MLPVSCRAGLWAGAPSVLSAGPPARGHCSVSLPKAWLELSWLPWHKIQSLIFCPAPIYKFLLGYFWFESRSVISLSQLVVGSGPFEASAVPCAGRLLPAGPFAAGSPVLGVLTEQGRELRCV